MSNTGRPSFLEVVLGNCKNGVNDIDVIEILFLLQLSRN
jgi:hypothetical protein